MSSEEPQESLFPVLDEMVKDTSPKKRKSPESWTEARKAQANALLKPWWGMYGKGWPQSYGAVFNVIVSVLSRDVSEEDIKQALKVLGAERKPISGGTIAFALSRTSKQVAEEAAYESAASSRSASKYIRREM